MFSKPASSLRLQLLRWLLVPLTALLLVNAWFSNRVAISTSNLAFDRLLQASADAISEDVDVKEGEIVVDLPYAALQLLESNIQERIFYRVVGPDGKTVTGYDDLPLPVDLAPTGEDAVLYSASYRGERIHLVAVNKQMYGANTAAPVVIVVAETGEARDALAHQLLVEGVTRQALLIGAAGLFVWFGLVRGLRPLSHLTSNLAQRDPADLSPIDPSSVQKEIKPLIRELNHHTGRIERLLAAQRRLIADASHQMRTPLSEMRVQIEVSLRDSDPHLWKQTLQDVQGDVERLTRLLGQLLLMARSDPEVLRDERLVDVDLAALAQDVAAEFVPAARKRAMSVTFEAPTQPVPISANPMLLREALINLVDNAVAYGNEGGHVVISVTREPDPAIVIADDGPGIPESERGKVFERFYRGKGAQGAGSGLGLSIVRDICAAHRARLDLQASESGTRITIVFDQTAPSLPT